MVWGLATPGLGSCLFFWAARAEAGQRLSFGSGGKVRRKLLTSQHKNRSRGSTSRVF